MAESATPTDIEDIPTLLGPSETQSKMADPTNNSPPSDKEPTSVLPFSSSPSQPSSLASNPPSPTQPCTTTTAAAPTKKQMMLQSSILALRSTIEDKINEALSIYDISKADSSAKGLLDRALSTQKPSSKLTMLALASVLFGKDPIFDSSTSALAKGVESLNSFAPRPSTIVAPSVNQVADLVRGMNIGAGTSSAGDNHPGHEERMRVILLLRDQGERLDVEDMKGHLIYVANVVLEMQGVFNTFEHFLGDGEE